MRLAGRKVTPRHAHRVPPGRSDGRPENHVGPAAFRHDALQVLRSPPIQQRPGNHRDAALGEIVGPSFSGDDVIDAVENLVRTYLSVRADGERFVETYDRVGAGPFKESLYGTH